MNSVTNETRKSLPKIVANLSIVLVFLALRYIVVLTLSSISSEIVFLLQIGLLIAAGIFLIRTILNVLPILDKTSRLFLKRLGILEGWSRQRVYKDVIYIVAIILVASAVIPLFSNVPNSALIVQQITTYSAFGLILLFVYDIGRTFYSITEKKANSVAKRFSNSENAEAT
ncbi:MAG: hypothetical protein CW716_11040 [Candidatus Bathyarchaeum sp.]|nr:MAG: hypothetical protein CW716_11040 [Candidatus Bathyarchaeum sp.]